MIIIIIIITTIIVIITTIIIIIIIIIIIMIVSITMFNHAIIKPARSWTSQRASRRRSRVRRCSCVYKMLARVTYYIIWLYVIIS